MELTLKRYDKDLYPACGFFVEGNDLVVWIAAIDRLGLDPERIKVFGLPSRRANELWGCLVITDPALPPAQLGPLAAAHLAFNQLVVPATSQVQPVLTDYDLERLLREDTYVLHPEVGLFKLAAALNLQDNVRVGDLPTLPSLRPADYTVASGEIRAFSVAPTPPEELELALAANVTREKLADQPLSLIEKLRLQLYKSILTTDGADASLNKKGDLLQRLANKLGLSGSDASEKILEDYQALEERNKKEVEKLLGLMQKDPEAALRYAIPLDEHGYSRGGTTSTFRLQDRGLNLSLFGKGGGGLRRSGKSVDLGHEFHRLREQYQASAKALEAEGKHEKAAYVYLKLLKNYTAAAETLRTGEHYEKAALVYLRYLKNEAAAAECYESGKIYDEAIPLYTKMAQWEKVGDLNILLGDESAAQLAYQQQLDEELHKKAYVRAAKLSQEKMHDLSQAQQVLLRGWDENVDAYHCLQYYLSNIADGATAWREIENIRAHRLTTQNDTVFMSVLKKEYQKQDEYQEKVRDMAYELLSELLSAGRISAHEVLAFNEENSRLRADALRYELKRKGR